MWWGGEERKEFVILSNTVCGNKMCHFIKHSVRHLHTQSTQNTLSLGETGHEARQDPMPSHWQRERGRGEATFAGLPWAPHPATAQAWRGALSPQSLGPGEGGLKGSTSASRDN